MNDFQDPEFEAGDPIPERRVNPRERAEERRSMIAEQIEARGVEDPFVLAALEAVPRHAFVRPRDLSLAYDDGALPLPHGQSISQPYVVAWMTEALSIGPTSRVLEVGTGSGYQTAVLAEITSEVYTIERQPQLAASAQKRLRRLGYSRPNFSVSNGAEGWREEAPFDAILVTAAAEEVPRDLLAQLEPSGRMVIPVGPVDGPQELRVYQRLDRQRFAVAILGEVRFVPLIDSE